jgi:hypothetical protein
MPFPRRNLSLCWCASAVLAFPAAALAAERAAASEAQGRYQEERARCMKIEPAEERRACLREAGAALQAARRGQLDKEDAEYERNLLARCSYLPAAERDDCERRMRGEGITTGSVEGGGIYRELRTIVPVEEGGAAR